LPVSLIPYLKKHFGYNHFRSNQEKIIQHILNKQDVLAIMPTGGGKSLCYQLPAVLLPKTTLVISPLIALMKDQVDSLSNNGIPAAFYNSTQSATEQNEILQQVAENKIKLLYVAPESLANIHFLLSTEYIGCIAIDEAHCISSWGHDFRPSYQNLSFLKKQLPDIPIIALTATADVATQKDIIQQLQIPDAEQYVSSFDRSNIYMQVRTADKRFQQIVNFIKKKPDTSGIIYCLSRKSTEEIAKKLTQLGYSANPYHAGLDSTARNSIQEDFIRDKTKIICATTAFGMGIDKSNIRWIIHYNMPKNIEGYYQEIGRAGRDGNNSEALLFYSYGDIIQLERFIRGAANEKMQRSKMERMKQFAEATSCRRRILLNYFGEISEKDCNNCDVCLNPPTFKDGTILAQKALSTIYRVKEKEGINAIIDILRGAKNQHVLDKKYPELSTYGIGKDISWREWQHYIIQFINQGLCTIAFHRDNHLQLTYLSELVLFKGLKVKVTKPTTKYDPTPLLHSKKEKIDYDVTLYNKLKKLRIKIANDTDMRSPNLIFNDASLKDMARKKPQSEIAFLEVSGMVQRKMELYAKQFIYAIINHIHNKKIDTFQRTLQYYKKGKTISEIALIRGLHETTIYSHIAKLYLENHIDSLDQFITAEETSQIREAYQILDKEEKLKPYFNYFEEKMPYPIIRLGLSIIQKEKSTTLLSPKE